jgi:hypothetical protein
VLLQVGETTMVYSHTQSFGVRGGGSGVATGRVAVAPAVGDAFRTATARATPPRQSKQRPVNGNSEGLDEQLQHSAVVVLGTVQLSLYGISNPVKNEPEKGRIAQICVSGVKLSELMFVQRNPVTQRRTDAYAIIGNVDKIDVPFQLGNASGLGLFLQEWKLETARSESSSNTMYDQERRTVAPTEEGAFESGRRPSVMVNVLIRKVFQFFFFLVFFF